MYFERENGKRDNRRIPSDDKPTSPNNLGYPINAICQGNVIHIDDSWDSCDGTDPEYGGCKKLDYRSYETNFLPTGSKPFPFLVCCVCGVIAVWYGFVVVVFIIGMGVTAVFVICVVVAVALVIYTFVIVVFVICILGIGVVFVVGRVEGVGTSFEGIGFICFVRCFRGVFS